jgi:hypothetical protein
LQSLIYFGPKCLDKVTPHLGDCGRVLAPARWPMRTEQPLCRQRREVS